MTGLDGTSDALVLALNTWLKKSGVEENQEERGENDPKDSSNRPVCIKEFE